MQGITTKERFQLIREQALRGASNDYTTPFKKLIERWKLSHCYEDENAETDCGLCGKKHLVDICVIQDILNPKNELEIGNICVNLFTPEIIKAYKAFKNKKVTTKAKSKAQMKKNFKKVIDEFKLILMSLQFRPDRGNYKDKPLRKVPISYIEYCANNAKGEFKKACSVLSDLGLEKHRLVRKIPI